MKALSLWQPWAQLVAIGAKRIETRCWSTAYRGPLAIHASLKWDRRLRNRRMLSPFMESLAAANYSPIDELPRGVIIAVCQLDDVIPIDSVAGGCMWRNGNRLPLPDEPERSFGDYTPGRFAWLLSHVVPVVGGKVRGAQRLFNLDEALDASLSRTFNSRRAK